MKKICFLTYNLFDLGGIQRVVTVLASELSKQHEIYIQCFDNPENENRERYGLAQNVHVIFTKRNIRQSMTRKLLRKFNQKSGILERIGNEKLLEYVYLIPEEQATYKRIIYENQIDIAVAVGPFESYLLGSIASEVNCKTIGWQHSSYKAYFETKGAACWGMSYIIDNFFPRLDRYVVLNEYDAMEFEKKKGFKCTTIYNPKSFSTVDTSELKNKRFISAGRFISLKGYDLLVRAFKLFSEKNTDWTLTIYGDGPEKENIKKLIQLYKLENRIFLPGFSENMEKNFMESSCYLLSSKWEGMPMVVLEALEVGIPIISFDITAIYPLVTNMKEGLLVPCFDVESYSKAMLTISSNDILRNDMGKSAKKKSKAFEVKKIAHQWNTMFNSLIKDKTGGVQL